MAAEQAAAEPASLTSAAKMKPQANPVRLTLFVYGIAADRITPYTGQALVQVYLLKIAPEVGGRVIEVGVDTDQRIEAGKVLFRIEPDQYVLAVRRAEAQLETIAPQQPLTRFLAVAIGFSGVLQTGLIAALAVKAMEASPRLSSDNA